MGIGFLLLSWRIMTKAVNVLKIKNHCANNTSLRSFLQEKPHGSSKTSHKSLFIFCHFCSATATFWSSKTSMSVQNNLCTSHNQSYINLFYSTHLGFQHFNIQVDFFLKSQLPPPPSLFSSHLIFVFNYFLPFFFFFLAKVHVLCWSGSKRPTGTFCNFFQTTVTDRWSLNKNSFPQL